MIILDDAHYRRTAEQIAGLEAGQTETRLTAVGGVREEWKRRLEHDAYESLILELRAQLREYDELKGGTIKSFRATGFSQMPNVLVKARIARGWSEKELAERASMDEERIRAFELSDYQSATFIEMAEIAAVLGLDFSCVASLLDGGGVEPTRRGNKPFYRVQPVVTR